MDEEYELKQVKVRLKLSEAEPLYSTEQITTPDKAAEVMADALAQMDREYCCVVNLDGANHPINFNVVSIGDANQAQVPIQNVFKSAILSNASSIMMFHNHPSGSVNASYEDIEVTKRLIEAGRIMNIPVLDHIIVAGGTAEHFSFRDSDPAMFSVHDRVEYSVHELQRRDALEGDSFTIYQLKGGEETREYAFESLSFLKKMGLSVESKNYSEVYTASLKQGTDLEDIFYEFNMHRPEDFTGHSLSVSDIVVVHNGETDRAFYVDRFGFTEIPDFLVEKEIGWEVETIASLTGERDRLLEKLLEEEGAAERFLLETGEASDRSDARQEGVDHLRRELEVVEEKLNNLYEQMEADAFDDEAAYKLGDRYISIQRTDEGYDYSIFDEDYHLLDGGVYDNPDMSIGEVLQEITDELKQPIYDEERDTYSHSVVQGNIRQRDVAVRVDYNELVEQAEKVGLSEIEKVRSDQKIVSDFRAQTEELFVSDMFDGMSPATIEEAVRDQVQTVIDDYGLDARIEDVIVSGSRCRGLEREGSDLDVVVSFSGTEREDDLFHLLHEEMMIFGSKGVVLDINPINTEQTGTLTEYLPEVEKYLTEKAIEIERDKAVIITEPEKPKQVVTFTVAESSEFHSFGELHEGIPTLQDAINIYEKMKHESSLNGIPGLGINVHTTGTEEWDDLQWDFMIGNRIDLEGLMYMPEMSQNAEVIEVLHQLADKYPEAEIIGHFPDESVEENSGPSVLKSDQRVEQPKQQTAEELAAEIDRFAYETDTYEYKATRAKELLKKLDEYKPLAKVEEMVEQNYNMIDNMINNLPKDPEEKKEPKPEKEMRIAEVKKVRKRVSMKALLSEKKAEVAAREKKLPEVGEPSKSPSMGVDD